MALQQLCGAVRVVSLPSKNIKTMEQKLKNANNVAGDIPSVANKVQADALQPMGEMNRYSELENGLKNFFGEDKFS